MKPLLFLFFGFFTVLSKAQSPVSPGSLLTIEKAYLHTDRETYAPGEDLWFKAYLVSAQTNLLMNSSNNLYVELIGPSATIIRKETVQLKNGLGNGDFHLDDAITAGTYRLRAYTNWMRNFGDNFVFEKTIRVYDGGKAESGKLMAESEKPKTQSGKGKAQSAPANAENAGVRNATVRFFPEGGSMIENVQGIVAIKAEDVDGKGIAAIGKITNTEGEVVAEFSCNANGMDEIGMTPLPGQTYLASGTFKNGKSFVTALPRALLTGFSMNVRTTDSLVRVIIGTNEPTLTAEKGKPVLLLVKSKDKPVFSANLLLTDLQNVAVLPADRLAPGINRLTVYDAAGKPQNERLIFVSRNTQATLSVITDQPAYLPKGKVTVAIKTISQDNLPLKASLSLAVVDAGMIPENETNIVSYLDLQSEIRGPIENAKQYFDEKNPKRRQQLDLLLLTQGWRDFVWKRLADSAIRISYPPESGFTVSGRLKQVWTKKPIPNSNITLTAWKAEGTRVLGTRTDSTGRFFLDGLNLTGEQEVKITAANNKGKKEGFIIVDTTFQFNYPVKKLVEPDTSYSLPNFEAEAEKRRQITTRLSLNDTIGLSAVNLVKLRAGRTLSDTTLIVKAADYPLKMLSTYILEKFPGALGNEFSVGFYGMIPRTMGRRGTSRAFFSTENPTAPRIEPDQYRKLALKQDYLGIPMDRVVAVQLVHNRNHDGIIQGPDRSGIPIYDGVLGDYFDFFLKVKPGAFDRQGYQAVNVSIDGYYEERTFYAPQYETPSAKPDVRTTIYWEPNITTNEKGEATISFYTADPKTQVRIVAEGVTETGIPLKTTTVYRVQ